MSSRPKDQGVEDARKNLPALLDRAGMPLSALRGSGKGLWGRSADAWVERLRKEW